MAGERSPNPNPSYDYDYNDATLVGKHCDVPSCNKLDFLPFKCESCKGTFCLDHRSETAHKCAQEGKWASERLRRELNSTGSSAFKSPSPANPPSPSTSHSFFSKFQSATRSGEAAGKSSNSSGHSLSTEGPCAKPTCKTTIHTARSPGVFCPYCRRHYCLAHRLQDYHNCKSLKQYPVGTESKSVGSQQGTPLVTEKAKAAFGKLKSSLSSSTSNFGAAKKASSPVMELMKLKRIAKGDEKIPPEKRVYVYVEAEARSTSSKIPKGEFYYSKDWSVGKMLDSAASSLGVRNINNQADNDETRLRVYHVEGGRILGFGEKFGDCVLSGNTVVLLRGVKIPDSVLEM